MVYTVESFLLIETDNGRRQVFRLYVVDRISKQEKIFKNGPARYSASLILLENQREDLA